MKTKKLKKLMTAALCVIFAVCFAFPASAVSSSVDEHVNRPGGISIHYWGWANQSSCYIGDSIGFSNPSFVLPENECYAYVYLTLKNETKTKTEVIDDFGFSYTVGAWGTVSFDPYYYKYQFSIAGEYYEHSNY